MKKISIRNAKYAKIGLMDLCNFIGYNYQTGLSDFIMAEIGCYVGDSTDIFLGYGAHIVCVDPWENGYDDNDGASHQHPMSIVEKQFDDLISKYDSVVKFKMTSEKAAPKFWDETFDLVYIDGLHTYEGVRKDIELWLPKIKKDGWIAGHDFGSRHFPGVEKAVREFAYNSKKEIRSFRDSSWLIQL